MRFELRPEYRDRKALYVDAEALALLRRTCLAPSTEAQEAGLEKVLPEEVMAELKAAPLPWPGVRRDDREARSVSAVRVVRVVNPLGQTPGRLIALKALTIVVIISVLYLSGRLGTRWGWPIAATATVAVSIFAYMAAWHNLA